MIRIIEVLYIQTMTQVSKYPISNATHERIFELFIKTLLNIRNKEDASQLIVDFFTPTEQIMFAKRLSVIFLLEKGYSYKMIGDILKVSTGTISQANRARKNGSAAYKKLIAKLVQDEKNRLLISKTLTGLVSLPAQGGEGSGIWKAAKKELQKDKKPF